MHLLWKGLVDLQEVRVMIFSCQYDTGTGRILAWSRSSSLATATELLGSKMGDRNGPRPHTGGALVTKFPSEILEHDERWPLANARVKDITSNGSVVVEIV